MQNTSKAMLEDIRSIRRSLEVNFQDRKDGYSRKMFRFSAVAEEDLHAIRDGILHAEKQFRDVQTFYGEGEEMGRPLQSQDFFGIFRTFTSSWKVRLQLDLFLIADSIVERRIKPDKRKPLRENGVRKLEPLSRLNQPAVPRQILLMHGFND